MGRKCYDTESRKQAVNLNRVLAEGKQTAAANHLSKGGIWAR